MSYLSIQHAKKMKIPFERVHYINGYSREEKNDFPLIVKEKGNNYAPNVCGRLLACFKRLEMGYLSIQYAKKMKILIWEGSLY